MTRKNLVPYKILFLILLFAGFLRLFDLNWDQNQHLHPDERFLTMVAGNMLWPDSLSGYFNTEQSTLNPHNIGYSFYVYGTWPVIVTKFVAQIVHLDDYNGLILVGRALSAVADILVVGTVYVVTEEIFKQQRTALLAAFSYAILVLPIQLAHFFAVDTFANLFTALAFLFALKISSNRIWGIWAVLTGVSLGFALSAKISAGIFIPITGLVILIELMRAKQYGRIFIAGTIIFLSCLGTVRLVYPYLFDGWHLNPKLLANWRELKSYDDPQGWFPPAILWIKTKAYLYPLMNLMWWGVGLPIFMITGWGLLHIWKKPRSLLLLLPILVIFAYQGGQYSKNMRYFLGMYPFIAIIMAVGWEKFFRKKLWPIIPVVLIAILWWPLSFFAIYTRPHSRVTASQWIYQHIPVGSNISCEAWDDCLPLNLPGLAGNGAYHGIQFTLFDPDTPQKWLDVSTKLAQLDYIILSSNRVYGSTMTVPERYPGNIRFYTLLFNGELGFEKIAEFTSRPNLPVPGLQTCILFGGDFYGRIARATDACLEPGISIDDDYAEETFTVYDHPKVLVFKKVSSVDYSHLLVKSDYLIQ